MIKRLISYIIIDFMLLGCWKSFGDLSGFKNYCKNIFKILLIYFLATFSVFSSFVVSAQALVLEAQTNNITNIDYLVPDGSTNTITDRAPNGTPIVNVAAPTAGGVSMNNFERYNITNENQVINNHKGDSVDTNLAGQIYGNPNYNPSGVNEARIIVMQTTSNNTTAINGYAEIAGRRAELIISNPNGIYIGGAGFINVSRLTLINGQNIAVDNLGALGDIAIANDGFIEISGADTQNYTNLGLDLTQVDFVDIVTRMATLTGDIITEGELNFRLGNDNFNYQTKEVSSISKSGAPTLALDSSYLGGMYANKIKIISTEDGVGVRTRGDLISDASSIDLNALGANSDVYIERADAATAINIMATGDVVQGVNQNATYRALLTAPEINIEADGNVKLEVLEADDINLTAGADITLGENEIAQNLAYFYATNDINLTAGGDVVLTGDVANNYIQADNDLTINSGGFNNDILVVALEDIEITADDYLNNAKLTAKNLTFTINGAFVDDGLIQADNNLTITSQSGVSLAQVEVKGAATITNLTSGNIALSDYLNALGDVAIENRATNVGGGDINLGGNYIYSGGVLSLTAKNDINLTLTSTLASGNINLVADSDLSGAGDINNSSILKSDADVNLTAYNLTNNNILAAYNDLNATTYNDLNNYGLIYARSDINLTVYNDLNNGLYVGFESDENKVGEIIAGGDVNINGEIRQTDFGSLNKYDLFILSFDKSAEIWAGLISGGYIDENGNITDAFKNLASADDLDLGASLSAYKTAIFNAINANLAKIQAQDFLAQISRNYDGEVGDIFDALVDAGYIDANGNILQKFFTDTASGNFETGVANYDCCLSDKIIDALNYVKNGLVNQNSFLAINSGNLDTITLMNDLQDAGYIDESGNISDEFLALGSFNDLEIDASFAQFKEEIYNQIAAIDGVNKVAVADFAGVNFDVDANIIDQSELYQALIDAGYLSENGKIANQYYAQEIDAGSDLFIYKTEIEAILNNAAQENFASNDLKNINKNLDNTAEFLIGILKSNNYLDANGLKTGDIPNSANDLDVGEDFAAYKSEIYQILANAGSSEQITDANFLNQAGLPESVFYDEKQLLLEDLKDAGYVDANGDILQDFYDIDDYSNLNLSSRFADLKTQVGDFIASNFSAENVSSDDLLQVATNNTKIEAQNILTILQNQGYLDSNGDITQSFYDEVLNYSQDHQANFNRLNLGDYQTYASGVYFKALEKLSDTDVKTFAGEVNNVNASKIQAGVLSGNNGGSNGDVNIFASALNNFGRDDKDVINDSESAINRQTLTRQGWAWKGTVLWGYDIITSNLDSNPSQINALNNINITADDITNNSSEITAGNNINIFATNLRNQRTEFTVNNRHVYEHHWKHCSGGSLGSWSCSERRWLTTSLLPTVVRSQKAGVISASNNITINALNDVLNDEVQAQNSNLTLALENAPTINDSVGDIDIALERLNLNSRLFKKANPDSEYLYESALNFTNKNYLTASRYYKERFGYDPNLENIKFLGDAYIEWQFINQQIIQATNKQIKWNNLNWQDNFNELIDNAMQENAQLGLELTPGVALTASQVASLTQDIIWYERINVDGQEVLAPKIYLANLDNVNLSNNSAIIAGNNIVINGDNISNMGNIIAGNNVNLNSSGDIANRYRIKAGNEVNLSALGDIINESKKITINNDSLVGGETVASLGLKSAVLNGQGGQGRPEFIKEYLYATASIEGGEINVNAGNDFTNKGANLTATRNLIARDPSGEPQDDIYSSGNITITAGDDINFETVALRQYSKNEWGSKKKGGMSISDVTTNVGSEVGGAGSVALASGNDTNVIGSDITAGENIAIDAGGAVNILAAQDSSYKETEYHKQGFTVAKNSLNINSSLTNIHSNLTAGGDINITSNDDTNLIGANLTGENIDIEAGADGSGDLNIFSVEDQNYSYHYATKSRNLSKVFKLFNPLLYYGAKLAAQDQYGIGGAIGGALQAQMNGDISSKTSINERNKITNQASNLNARSDLTLTAADDINIAGSKLTGDNANLTATNGDVAIYNVVDLDYSRSETYKTKTTWSSVASSAIQLGAIAISNFQTAFSAFLTPKQKADKFKENHQAAQNIPQKQETNIKINSDETVVASQLEFNNITINSGNDINLTSANLLANEDLTINSGNDTNIATAVENDYSYEFNQKKNPNVFAALSNAVVKIFNDSMPKFGRSGKDETESNNKIDELVYDQSKFKEENTTKTNVASNLYANLAGAGGDIDITSENNNLISGSNLSADNINLTALNGTTIITSAQDESSKSTETVDQDYNDLSANFNRGRLSVDSTSNILENVTTITTITQKQSNLAATGNINIVSKDDVNILSSNLGADGEVALASEEGNVNILALQNSQTVSSETKTGTLTLSAGIGSTHVDVAYAGYDLAQAVKNLAEAKKQLNHMETLEKNGQASSEAVEDARINLTIAGLNLYLAKLKYNAAAAKNAGNAKQSLGTGLYADLKLSIAGSKTNFNSTSLVSVASNINSGGDINVSSGTNLALNSPTILNNNAGNLTITGANITTQNGDINLTAKNNIAITASKDTYNSSTTTKSWEENLTLASTVAGGTGAMIDNAINALAASLSLSRSSADTSSTTYNNSRINALNGNLNLTSGKDTELKGANLLAENVDLEVGGDLNIESLQNSYLDKSKSFGMSLGGSRSGSVSGGVNYSSSKNDRVWTDNQTSIIGTNSVNINTANSTNIKGAIIANISNAEELGLHQTSITSQTLANAIDGGNLTLTTNTLTYENLFDHHYTESFGANFSTTIGTGLNSNDQNPSQTLNFYPEGSTTIGLQNSSTRKEQTSFASIGNGNITTNRINGIEVASNDEINSALSSTNLNRDITNSQIITKDQITGALDIEVTIDNRAIAAAYELATDAKQDILNDNTLTDEQKQEKINQLQSTILDREGDDAWKNTKISLAGLAADAKIAKDNIVKLACKDCFVSKEMKELASNINLEDKQKLPEQYQQALDKFINDVEKETELNIRDMTNEERIEAFNRLKNSDKPLTNQEMRFRDALWATAKEDKAWNEFREGHITQIADAIVNDSTYIAAKNKWIFLDDSVKQTYIEGITQKQQDIFGDDRVIVVEFFDKESVDGYITNGTYSANSNLLRINTNEKSSIDDFFNTINVASHEYGGHGYQDFVLENKDEFLLKNPQFSNMVKFLDLSYDVKVWPGGGIYYEKQLKNGVYRSDLSERDAWHIGLGTKDALTKKQRK